MENDVFISYSHVNSVVADAICHKFEEAGIRCWYAPRNIQPGDDWAEAIINAIKSTRMLVLIFSDESNDSVQVRREISAAVSAELPIIPFKITAANPTGSMEYYLNTLHWLDAVDEPLDEAIDRLLAMSKAILDADSTAKGGAQPAAPAPVHAQQSAAKQSEAQPAAKQEGSSKRGLFIALGIVAVLAIALIGAFASGVFGGDDSSGSQSTSTTASSTSANTTSSTTQATQARVSTVDWDSVDVHSELPYVVADDELCTIIFAGYHMASDKPVAEFLFVNNSQTKYSANAGIGVVANGIEIPNFSGATATLEPGGYNTGWGSFFGTDEKGGTISLVHGELETLQCEIELKAASVSQPLGSYALNWEKNATSGKGARNTDQLVIDEEKICAMRITKVTEIQNGYVVVFYNFMNRTDSQVKMSPGDDWVVNGSKATVVSGPHAHNKGQGYNSPILLHVDDGDQQGTVTSISGTVSVADKSGNALTARLIELQF